MIVGIFFVICFSLALIGTVAGLSREIRTRRRAGGLERALRALAARPGWRSLGPGEYRSDHQLMHYPWLDADFRRAVAGTSNGSEVLVVELMKIEPRRGTYWLAVYFQVPGNRPLLRLERAWSAAALGIPVHGDGTYLPMSSDVDALTARLVESDLLERLCDLGAPAVSVTDDRVGFLYHPIPNFTDLRQLTEGLAVLLPALVELAGTSGTSEAEA
ncbi:hypothetical protein [Streptomyces sp. MN13]